MKDPREVIIRPIISEHSYEGMENNVYTFEVAKSANKIEIAQAIEAIFDVKVVKVNTINVKPKPKRVRYQLVRPAPGRRPWLRLLKGDQIEIIRSGIGCLAKNRSSERFFFALELLLRSRAFLFSLS